MEEFKGVTVLKKANVFQWVSIHDDNVSKFSHLVAAHR